MSKLVSVFCCGVQKGGTTSLHAYFAEHPALSPPRYKEIHFFDGENLDSFPPDYAVLDAFYSPDDGDRRRFDITPIYSFWPPALARIHKYNPNARLIFLFRDPFERAWSNWCMSYAFGHEVLPFAEAIREGRRRMDELPPLASERRVYSYVERGFYAEQVRRALAYFPRENMLFLRSQDLFADHRATLASIATFLDIPPFPDIPLKRENARPGIVFPSVPSEADRLLIAGLVRHDLREFADLTGLDISDWATMR